MQVTFLSKKQSGKQEVRLLFHDILFWGELINDYWASIVLISLKIAAYPYFNGTTHKQSIVKVRVLYFTRGGKQYAGICQ